jgi:hypothetical protein
VKVIEGFINFRNCCPLRTIQENIGGVMSTSYTIGKA